MAAATVPQINEVNNACNLALQMQQCFSDMIAFQANYNNSTSAQGIGSADFTNAPGNLKGFNPAIFTAFVTQLASLLTSLAANSNAIPIAVQAMSENHQ